MKKTLSEKYLFLSFYKILIILSFVIYTIISIKLINEVKLEKTQFLYSILTYIFLLVSVVSMIMIINFLFKLDRTKNNLEGKKIKYYVSGEKLSEVPYKDGEPDGLYTEWYLNGEKEKEGTFKDGIQDGLWTLWYENGQKKFEITFKDGKEISKKEWNEDGSVKE